MSNPPLRVGLDPRSELETRIDALEPESDKGNLADGAMEASRSCSC